ncbi:MAG: GNAT family N-acetyltransferase [Oscillospiraceae bacterium]
MEVKNMAELRLMETDDIQECTELYLDAFHHKGETKEKMRADLPAYYEQYIEKDYCMAYVLEENDTIIGIVTAIIVPGIGLETIYIDTVAILSAYQHKGYGTQMLNEFIKRTQGKFFSISTVRNGIGFKLYHKVGFSDTTDSAYLINIPGVTDNLNRLQDELKALSNGKNDTL